MLRDWNHCNQFVKAQLPVAFFFTFRSMTHARSKHFVFWRGKDNTIRSISLFYAGYLSIFSAVTVSHNSIWGEGLTVSWTTTHSHPLSILGLRFRLCWCFPIWRLPIKSYVCHSIYSHTWRPRPIQTVVGNERLVPESICVECDVKFNIHPLL